MNQDALTFFDGICALFDNALRLRQMDVAQSLNCAVSAIANTMTCYETDFDAKMALLDRSYAKHEAYMKVYRELHPAIYREVE